MPPRVPRASAPFGFALFIAQLRVLFDLDDAMDGRPVASLESTERSRRGSDAPFGESRAPARTAQTSKTARDRPLVQKLTGGARGGGSST